MVAMQAKILLGESFPARLWPLETMEYSRYGSSMSWWDTNGTTLQKNAGGGGRAGGGTAHRRFGNILCDVAKTL